MSQFLDNMIAKAKANKKKIVLAEGFDKRIVKAAADASNGEIADIIILGQKDEICKMANEQNCDISKATIVDPLQSDKFDDYASTLLEMRKAKGMTEEMAVKLMKDPLYFGVMMVHKGDADGMVAGACNATANVIRPALQILKTAPGTKLVSAFFMMCVPNCPYGEGGNLIFADSGLNENPDAEQVSEIAISSAKTFKAFIGAEPKVAMLSYSTYGSAKSDLVEKMQIATKLVKEKAPELQVDGELQLDAAIVPSVAALKCPESTVAGKANVLVFPDLNAGNIGYKLVQRFANAEAYGPILQGIRKPVNDLSRGCSAEDVVGVIAITSVQAQALD
ncbi:MAG: phosphate acetyltransferase [Clostridia bacterium]